VEERVSWSIHPSTRENGISARFGFTFRIIKARSSNLVHKTGHILTKELLKAVPWLRRLVSGFTLRRLGFEPGLGHVGFVAEKMALGGSFLRVLRFSPANLDSTDCSTIIIIIIYHPGLVQ
jgi:hypothetical protein